MWRWKPSGVFSMGGTRLKFDSWKVRKHTQNASQNLLFFSFFFFFFLTAFWDIWFLKSGCSLKNPTHGLVSQSRAKKKQTKKEWQIGVRPQSAHIPNQFEIEDGRWSFSSRLGEIKRIPIPSPWTLVHRTLTHRGEWVLTAVVALVIRVRRPEIIGRD